VHIDTVLLKVASRCNLDCAYCYVYHMGDESWRSQPKRLLDETQVLIARELGSLVRTQGRPFSIVFHGGEPLLMGKRRLEFFFDQLRAELGYHCGISVQTNGILINEAVLDICSLYDVTLSVSLDGPAVVHDRFRIDLRRHPTHAKVVAGIATLKAHSNVERLFSGILAVVDPTSDPNAIYDYFKELGVPSVDFLYRDGNHAVLPYGKASANSLEYGKWMCAILDRYVSDATPFRIRMLDDMMRLILGGQGVKEGLGLTDYGILVIDTDGSVKKNDTLKSSPPGDSFKSHWELATHSLSEIAASPEFQAYHRAQRPTSALCQACPVLKVCGGGMVTHRFKQGSGYDNPTVFCADQLRLIAHMKKHVAAFQRRNGA
jgi:uncharacterized protein